MERHLLAGYRQLIDDYFVYLQRGELNPSRGLCFTRMAEGDETTEIELVSHLIQHLRLLRLEPLLVDWTETLAAAVNQGAEFRQFFGRLWELQSSGASNEDQAAYVERLNLLMNKVGEPDAATATAAILYTVPPLQEMSAPELEQLQRLLAIRMERGLPTFAFFRESYSDLLQSLQRASDAIWALDETTYSAEFYLMHPHGFRIIQEQNRRRPLRGHPPVRDN